MDRYQNLVSLAVDPYRIIEVFVLIARSELNIDVLTDARGHHTLFVVLDLEEACLWRQNVQPLRSWRVVDQLDFECVGLA